MLGLALIIGTSLIETGISNPVNIIANSGGLQTSPRATIVLSENFSSQKLNSQWQKTENYRNNLIIAPRLFQGKNALVMTNKHNKKADTAFGIKTKLIKLNKPINYSIKFKTAQTGNINTKKFVGNQIIFYNQNQEKISQKVFSYFTPKQGYNETTIKGGFPVGAKYIKLYFYGDSPDIKPGEALAITDIKIAITDLTNHQYYSEGNFISRNIPIKPQVSPAIAWELSGENSTISFQIATAPDVKGFPGKYGKFIGPDGSVNSYFTQPGQALNNIIPANHSWIRYRGRMISSKVSPGILKQVCIAGNLDQNWKISFDSTGPQITRISPSPNANRKAPVKIKITSLSAIDWSSLKIVVNNHKTSCKILRGDFGITLVPQTQFLKGINEIHLKLADFDGRITEKTLYFRTDEYKALDKITIRDDGMMLINNKPFFPIGAWAIKKLPINNHNLDKAFSDLKKIGFNFVRISDNKLTSELLAKAHQYNMKIQANGYMSPCSTKEFVKSIKKNVLKPSIVVWYIGDDTSRHLTPQQVADRTEAVKSLAPHLLTVQADGVAGYSQFVDKTQVFEPEIYPVYGGKQSSASCVSEVIRDMKLARKIGTKNTKLPKTIWPLIQYFSGRSWSRLPDILELRAMSYAAIISGAHGIIWYTYDGFNEYQTMTTSPQNWQTMSQVSREIADFAPIFCEPNALKQINPIIISGRKLNTHKNPSVIALTKKYGKKTYVFAVNSVRQEVEALFEIADYHTAKLLKPEQKISIQSGKISIKFNPFEVKIIELQ